MTEDAVMTIFTQANPAPDVEALAVDTDDAATYLATLDERSSGVTQLKTRNQQETAESPTRRRRWLVAAIIVAVIGVGAITLTQIGEDDTPEAPVATNPEVRTPEATVEGFFEAFNNGDVDSALGFFADGASIVGHPFSSARPADSPGMIRTLLLADLNVAADTDAYQLSGVTASNGTVTWNHTFTRSNGESFCVAGHTATVENGLIVSWTWPGDFGC